MLDPHAKAGAVRTTPEGAAWAAIPATSKARRCRWRASRGTTSRCFWRGSTRAIASTPTGCRPRRSGNTPAKTMRGCGRARMVQGQLRGRDAAGGRKAAECARPVRHAGQRRGVGAGLVRHDYYAESPAADPPGPATGSYRVFRGGSWLDPAKYCRITARNFEFPVSRLYNVGFRVVTLRGTAGWGAVVRSRRRCGVWNGSVFGGGRGGLGPDCLEITWCIAEVPRLHVPEPVHSCIILGGVGAFAFGGVLFAAILLLGHERPMGWEFSRIPPLMGLSFVLFSIVGLPVGLSKRRRAPVP
jgi:hypothetical protein